MISVKTVGRYIILACCILQQYTLQACSKKIVCRCAVGCTTMSRMIIPSFYPATFRTPEQEQLNRNERTQVMQGTQESLSLLQNIDTMSTSDIIEEKNRLIEFLDTHYGEFEQLPKKNAPLSEKIEYTAKINRVRQLQIALRD